MAKKGTSKLAAGGRRALVTLGLRRRSTGLPVSAVIAGIATVAGAAFALVPLARRALAHRAFRAEQPLVDVSPANGNEAEELGRAENEGLRPGPS